VELELDCKGGACLLVSEGHCPRRDGGCATRHGGAGRSTRDDIIWLMYLRTCQLVIYSLGYGARKVRYGA